MQETIDYSGLKLHTRYAYPAFASVEKYKPDLPFLERQINEISDEKKLLKFFSEKCQYLLLYVPVSFSIDDVRNYWTGYGRKSHTCVKFRDWLLDDILLKDIPSGRSVKCDIVELNRCNVVQAEVVEGGEEPLVMYLVYKYENSRLELVQEMAKIKLLFDGPVKKGEYIAKHFNYGVEKITPKKDPRVELVDAFNSGDKDYFVGNIELAEGFIDMLIEKLR